MPVCLFCRPTTTDHGLRPSYLVRRNKEPNLLVGALNRKAMYRSGLERFVQRSLAEPDCLCETIYNMHRLSSRPTICFSVLADTRSDALVPQPALLDPLQTTLTQHELRSQHSVHAWAHFRTNLSPLFPVLLILTARKYYHPGNNHRREKWN